MNAVTPIQSAAPLAERVMLARLKICKWTAVKLDKGVTRGVIVQHNAIEGAGRFNKRLVGKEALAAIDTIANTARGEHAARTLPWSDEGPRILSARGFVDYSNRMRELKGEFDDAVSKFVANYPAYIDAAKVELNGMFKDADYPAAADIAARFTFGVEFTTLPDSADFRVNLDSGQVADIKAAMDSNAREAFAAATRDVWGRVAEAVGRMAERLKAYKPAAGKGNHAENVFRDSLVENVRSLVRLLPSLNIADDPALAGIAARMERELCGDDAKALRENDSARASVAAAAEQILSDVSAYLA